MLHLLIYSFHTFDHIHGCKRIIIDSFLVPMPTSLLYIQTHRQKLPMLFFIIALGLVVLAFDIVPWPVSLHTQNVGLP